MSDDLVKRLRGWRGFHQANLSIEAADRIEALTAERDHAWAMVAKADTQVGQSLADHMQAKAERDRLREALNQSRLAFAGLVSVQSAIDLLDSAALDPNRLRDGVQP